MGNGDNAVSLIPLTAIPLTSATSDFFQLKSLLRSLRSLCSFAVIRLRRRVQASSIRPCSTQIVAVRSSAGPSGKRSFSFRCSR